MIHPRPNKMKWKWPLLWVIVLFWQGCSCCLYLNHVYNTRKYYHKGEVSLIARRDSVPTDSSAYNATEKKYWDKVIHTGSLVLDRWPDEKSYKPEVLWRMGDAYFYSAVYDKALTKYNEYERYFPSDKELPRVQYQRLRTLVKMQEFNLALSAGEELLVQQPDHPFRTDIEDLLALSYQNSNRPQEAIAALRSILSNPNADPISKANAHFRLGDIYFALPDYPKAIVHYSDSLLIYLHPLRQYKARIRQIESYFALEERQNALPLIETTLKDPQFAEHQWTLNVLRGLVWLNSPQFLEGEKLLDSLSMVRSEVDSASFNQFTIAQHRDSVRGDYQGAIEAYTAAKTLRPYSVWGKLADERILKLRQFMRYSEQPDDSLTPSQRFQFAEIWYAERRQSDSALAQIDAILADSSADSVAHLRALYTRAYLLETAKADTSKAQEIYHQIIEQHPQTEYARQSRRNLGMQVNWQSQEDIAQTEYAQVESLYYSLDSLAFSQPVQYDSLFPLVLIRFDSLAHKWEGTSVAPQSLFFKAWIYEYEVGNLDSARAIYAQVQERYPESPWGIQSIEKLTAQINEHEQESPDITVEKKTLIDMEKANAVRIKRREEWNKKLEAQKPNAEELLWDYNKMYDF